MSDYFPFFALMILFIVMFRLAFPAAPDAPTLGLQQYPCNPYCMPRPVK